MKRIQKLIVLLCAAWMLFSMSGCRYSSVVERIIYDYLRANQTDMEKNTYDNKEDNEKDDDLNDLEKDDESDRENDAEEVDPIHEQDQEPTQDDHAGSPNYDDDSNQDNAAGADLTPASGGEISGGQSSDDANGTEESSENAPEEGIIPDHDGERGTTGGDTTRLVVDDYGSQYEVPQNVNTVAAVDSAAVAVLMLGGVDRLAATNEELASDPLAAAVFSGLSGVPALWSESGTTEPLNDSDLQRLIEIHPDVCFETSGSATFSNAQVEALRENGIYYVVLPAPTSVTNLKLIAQVVGEVLGDHTSDGGYDSAKIAQSYRSWVDKTISTVSGASGGSYTLYVDDWDTEAYYTIDQASECYGYGAAIINNGHTDSCKAVSDFLKAASVTNVTSLGAFSRTESIYFTPIDVNYSTVAVTGSEAGRLTPVKLLVAGNYLGSAAFRNVIVSSGSVKEELENNELWQYFGTVTSSNGNFTDYGFLDDYGEIVRSTITGEYTVIVNPRGVGAWASGSVESVLEAVWADYAFNDGCSEKELRGVISEFYKTFYRYTLSESQLDAILAGES